MTLDRSQSLVRGSHQRDVVVAEGDEVPQVALSDSSDAADKYFHICFCLFSASSILVKDSNFEVK
jgi:hypothetical protein